MKLEGWDDIELEVEHFKLGSANGMIRLRRKDQIVD